MCSGRVSPEFVWYAFKKGAPVVLVSGCHYVDCHYIDANRSTTRRVDGLWDGLEKAGIDPSRLMLEWCSAAEGSRWQHIMEQCEEKRISISADELDSGRKVLKDKKVPGPRNPRPSDEGQSAGFRCLACGESWEGTYRSNQERICPSCRSNSVQWLRRK